MSSHLEFCMNLLMCRVRLKQRVLDWSFDYVKLSRRKILIGF